ncbi:chromosome partitioning protein ParB [Caldovatus sediminis]|uniref:Chromosome partitioning protein ParB n=1 Tax=Caldovatus sediminis TaxID=2041189 RepID=A0A8J2ZDD3_9PROT|nr:plasmid partitioning protein RepB C-terminal domain-containing protein [Caldovatus sediminis]GGG42325.1 chromosome partitioning protein ParB [Caldovatus sediminis]
MTHAPVPTVQHIPVDAIDVVNPRARNRRVFQEIVDSIAAVGLKRPITVAARRGPEGLRYDLVCGRGRLEAFRELGQATIPAVVIEAAGEDCLVMSLVENVARRQHQALDLLHDIDGMRQRGHSDADIARKTGLSLEYVKGVLRLLTGGETRLLRAVEVGQIPVSVAVEIAEAEDADVQQVLHEAYERNLLRGQSLLAAKRLIEVRRSQGRRVKPADGRKARPLSVDALVRTYRQDVDKKRLIVRDAAATRGRLLFVVEALRALMADEGFVTLLRAEGLLTMPAKLAERVGSGAGGG